MAVTKWMVDAGVAAYREWEDKNVLPFELAMAANDLAVERLIVEILIRTMGEPENLDDELRRFVREYDSENSNL